MKLSKKKFQKKKFEQNIFSSKNIEILIKENNHIDLFSGFFKNNVNEIFEEQDESKSDHVKNELTMITMELSKSIFIKKFFGMIMIITEFIFELQMNPISRILKVCITMEKKI